MVKRDFKIWGFALYDLQLKSTIIQNSDEGFLTDMSD